MMSDIKVGDVVTIIEHNDDCHTYRVASLCTKGAIQYAELDPRNGGPYRYVPRIYLKLDIFRSAIEEARSDEKSK